MPRAAAPLTAHAGKSTSEPNGSLPHTGVVIPIRSFTDAKARLADHLDADARASAMRSMAERVVLAAAPMPVVVVTSAPEVCEFALLLGAEVLDDPGSLNAAAAAGVEHVAARGFDRAVVAHADLPHARSLAAFARDATRPIVALAPCHRHDGTNVLALPTNLRTPFHFAYGEASFHLHLQESRRLGLGTRVILDDDLAQDVDQLEDLVFLSSLSRSAEVGSH
jgi:2-phospho-L-lactate/phosphoenolpyruvate guanylyltransferase